MQAAAAEAAAAEEEGMIGSRTLTIWRLRSPQHEWRLWNGSACGCGRRRRVNAPRARRWRKLGLRGEDWVVEVIGELECREHPFNYLTVVVVVVVVVVQQQQQRKVSLKRVLQS